MSETLFEYPSAFLPGDDGRPTNYVDFDQLRPLVEQRSVRVNSHPTLPYDIYNYAATHSQRTGIFEDPIIDDCRGLIVDRNTGLVVARPFQRMTQLKEHEELPEGTKTVFEKLDGSMGVQYVGPDGELLMSSRGSFTGSHAQRGTEMLQEYRNHPFDPELTYVWEMIAPEDEHPVDYGDHRGIVLLGTIVTATGVERPLSDDIDLPTVRTFEGEDFETAAAMRALDWENAEGFVARMEGGEHAGERYKVKFPGYRWLTKEFNGEMEYYVHSSIMSGSKKAAELIGWAPPSVRPMMIGYVDALQDKVRAAGGQILSDLEALKKSESHSPKERQAFAAAYNALVRELLTTVLKRPPKPRSANRGRHNMRVWS
ncbi:MAG TPA: RNA ligase [Candidatus Saccharimonadales bacterium]|nr:RNA ligase [Candidatus Saccharimonadales bacterium]